jgi:hypothetical protein
LLSSSFHVSLFWKYPLFHFDVCWGPLWVPLFLCHLMFFVFGVLKYLEYMNKIYSRPCIISSWISQRLLTRFLLWGVLVVRGSIAEFFHYIYCSFVEFRN